MFERVVSKCSKGQNIKLWALYLT